MLGTRLGPYRIDGELGAGGMGRVFRAEATGGAVGIAAGTQVALKVIHPHLLETEGFFKRFLREADIGRRVVHENVVRTYDCDALLVDGEQQHFLVMEYVEGQTLRRLLDELGSAPEELCRHVGRQVACGLQAIHGAGVVHRDLKPENVLITPTNRVKIMDLGVARLQDEAIRLSRTGHFVGSVLYAAPEAFRSGGADVDARADLYGLGVLLYELATGRHPYRDDDLKVVLRCLLEEEPRRVGEVNPQLSPFFEELVHTLLGKDREARFASASVLEEVLEQGERGAWWQGRVQTLRQETRRPLRRIRIPRETALFGRETELGALAGLYEKAKAGEGQALLLGGEAGIGKTRLVDEFVAGLRQAGEDVNFLFGSYPPGGAATAAGAFTTAYREHFGAEGLEQTLREYLPVTPVLVPAFAALLRGEPPPTGQEPLTKESLQTVFLHATRELARERPTIVLIDDLHFAPEEGRALFAALACGAHGHPLLLVGTMRPGVPAAWASSVERQEHTSRLDLERLGAKDLARLLEDAFHSKRLARKLGHEIARKSDGNPFFAFEIIRGLRDGRYIQQRPDGTWVTTKVITDFQMPSTVMDLVRTRLTDLEEEDANLLEVASCCGFTFDPLLVARVLEQDSLAVLRRLGRIEKVHAVVRSAGRMCAFDHHQVHELLYDGLSDLLKERYHAAIAQAWEERERGAERDPEGLDGALCVNLCDHYLKGACGEKALGYLGPALLHLEHNYLNDPAIALLDRALDVPGLLEGDDRARMLLRKNARLDLLGRREEQQAAIEEATALVSAQSPSSLVADFEHARGALHFARSRYDEARAHFERWLEIVREAGDRKGEVAASARLGSVSSILSRTEEARTCFEHSIAIAQEIGDLRGEAAATGNLGLVFLNLGQSEEAEAYCRRQLELARKAGNRRSESIATGNLGLVYADLGRAEEARTYFERKLEIAREMGDREGEAVATANLGMAYHRLGRYEEARERYERCLETVREIGARDGEAHAAGNLGTIFFGLGRYREAQAHYERQLEIVRAIGDRWTEGSALSNLGRLGAARGRADEARATWERALVLVREIGAARLESYVLHGLAALAADQGGYGTAERLHEQALTLRRKAGAKDLVAESLLALGRLDLERERPPQAAARLEEALALGRETDAAAVVLLGAVHRTRLPGGDPEAARAALEAYEERVEAAERMEARFVLYEVTKDLRHLQEAKRLLDLTLEHADPEDRDAMLANVVLLRRIRKAGKEHEAEPDAMPAT